MQRVRFWDADYRVPIEVNGYPLRMALFEHSISSYYSSKRDLYKYRNFSRRVKGAGESFPEIGLYLGISHHGSQPQDLKEGVDFSINMRAFPERLPELWKETHSRQIMERGGIKGQILNMTSEELHAHVMSGKINELFEPVKNQSGAMLHIKATLSEYIILLLLEEAINQVTSDEIVLLKNPIIETFDNPELPKQYTTSEADALILFWKSDNLVCTLEKMKALTKEIDVYYRPELNRH